MLVRSTLRPYFFFLIFFLPFFTFAQPIKYETRGLWVSTIHNLDWPTSRHASPDDQKQEFIRLLKLAKSCNINTFYVQIRNACDAFYPSEIEPWSQWLTGKQGKAPEPFWDPLQFMIEECHKRGIEFHAWFNPFRAVSHVEFSDVSRQHVSKKQKKWCFQYGKTLYLDPGIPEVREYILSVVKDVTTRYDIDGIHLDDYFYPAEQGREYIEDYHSYAKYNPNSLSKDDWRRENINQLIKDINTTTKAIKKHVVFGISPVAVWRHDNRDILGSDTHGSQSAYDDLYADIRLWLEKGWIDYVIPQLYHRIGHRLADFRTLERWWSENAYGRNVYTGLALYKLAEGKEKNWNRPRELTDQIKICRANPTSSGMSLYRAWSYFTNPWSIRDSLQTKYFKYPALVPKYPWIDSIPPKSPVNVKNSLINGVVNLSWERPRAAADGDYPSYYVVYKFKASEPVELNSSSHIVAITKDEFFTDFDSKLNNEDCYYLVKSMDRLHNESIGFSGVYYEK